MRTIWKLPLSLEREQILSFPQASRDDNHGHIITGWWPNAQVVHAAAQNNIPTLWVRVDTAYKPRRCKLIMINTGESFDDVIDNSNAFVGTILLDNGATVKHLFIEALYD